MTREFFGQPLRVAVLTGGDSPERSVSLASGEQVLSGLAAAGHQAQAFDPAEVPLAAIPWCEFDVCFIALHGGAGEDGRVQAELERLNVPYTGSGPGASRLAMSKSASKERWQRAGIPTPPFVRMEDFALPLRGGANFPLVVKPDGQGSSLGVSVVRRPEELAAALDAAFALDALVIAERWIEGREFTVALLGREPLPLLEIVRSEPIFSYHAKYSTGAAHYRFDHGLPCSQEAAIRDAAIAAAEVIGTKSLARVDLMLDRAGRPWVLEVNTVPGLTAHSLAPRAAAQAGIEMPALCDWMREALPSRSRLPGGTWRERDQKVPSGRRDLLASEAVG